ncbi:hypothetical protein ACFQ0Q_32490 [Streptomyces aureus]
MAPAPKAAADPVRAVAAGLLNLTGLGAGYFLLRRWVLAAVCLAATAVLLVLALPAEPDGVPAGLLVGYGFLLLVAALDAARRAATTSLRSPVVAMALGIVLLAVPAGGVVAYGAARDDAVEEMLLGRLDDADALVVKAAARATFAEGRADYTTALARYRELAHDHAGSKAAGLVPDRLDAYYKAVAKPYTDKKDCEAIEPLTYLRTVPDKRMDRQVLGSLATWPDKPLAASLYACGTARLGTGAAGSDGGELGRLLRTFPKSEQAGQVEAPCVTPSPHATAASAAPNPAPPRTNCAASGRRPTRSRTMRGRAWRPTSTRPSRRVSTPAGSTSSRTRSSATPARPWPTSRTRTRTASTGPGPRTSRSPPRSPGCGPPPVITFRPPGIRAAPA